MTPDKFQQAWQAQSSQTTVRVDADLLWKEVQRNQSGFRAIIFRRDVIEIGIALLLLPYWFYAGVRYSLPWTWYLSVPVLAWLAGFQLAYRMRRKPTPGEPGEPLRRCVEVSMTEVEDQIWLLRNIFWWYLLPPGVSVLAFFLHVSWRAADDWLEFLGRGSLQVGFLAALYGFVYFLNQQSVRKQLEPRRQELRALLAGLGDEAPGENESEESAAFAAAPDDDRRATLRSAILTMFVLAAITTLASVAAVYLARVGNYPKLAPYSGVRWEGEEPAIEIGGEWFRLVSLDGIPASEIVAVSRKIYGDRWKKRFEEDLVELLTRMGHPPGKTVRLVVQSLTSTETRVLEEVPMTAANRQAVKAAADARANAER